MVAEGNAGYAVQEKTSGITDPNSDAKGKMSGAMIQGRVATGDAEDAGMERAGWEDPAQKTAATKEDVVVRTHIARGEVDAANDAAADPRTAAESAGQGAAYNKLQQHEPEQVTDAQADVNVASSTYADPQGAARARAEAKLAEKTSDADSATSVQAEVTVGTKPDPDKK
jgi:hypothetical protein